MGVFGAKSVVGVYLDSGSLSVLSAQQAGADAKVLGFSSSPGGLTTGTESDAAQNQRFAERIRKAFQEAAAQSKWVSVAVPAEGAMIRYFDLPVLPKKEEKSAVRFEAQKYVPLDMKDLYYDYERYPDASGKKVRVVLFACKKKWVDHLSAMVALAGGKVERVELASQAIVRAFSQTLKKKTEQVEAMIFPNDDQRSAELILFKGNAVLFTRHLAFAQTRDTLSVDVPFFVSEVRISFDYFFENFKNEKIAKIHLIASPPDGSRQALQQALQQELSIPTELGNFPQKIAGNTILSTGSAAAYGLTLGDFVASKTKLVDLRPVEGSAALTMTWEEEKKLLQDHAVKVIFGVAVVLIGVYVLLSGTIRSKNTQLQRTYSNYPATVNASIQDPLPEMQSKQNLLIGKLAFGSALLDKRNYFTPKMNELAKTVPAQMRLVQMRYEDSVNSRGESELLLHLEGYVTSADSSNELTEINRFVKQLMSNKAFMAGLNEIKIMSTKKTSVKAVPAMRFALDCVGQRKS